MSGLVGNVSSLKAFAAKLRELPRVLAIKVAAEVAPALTAAGKATFDAGENAYGITWKPLEDGQRATLDRTGALASGLVYVAIGTKIRVQLGVPYAKYVVGRRPVFPTQGSPLPPSYVEALKTTVARVASAELGVA